MGRHAAVEPEEDRLLRRSVAAFQSFCQGWNEAALTDFQLHHDTDPDTWHRAGHPCRFCP